MDTAAVWTLITLQVATLLGVFYFLANRIEAVRVELSGRVDRVESRIDRLDDNLDATRSDLIGRIDGTRRELKAELQTQAVRLDAHVERHTG